MISDGTAVAATTRLTVTPPAGSPGTVVTVHGTGFCPPPCSPVNLLISGRPMGEGHDASSAGSFTAKLLLPGGQVGGDLEIVATQTTPTGAERRASALFTYSPSKGEQTERDAEDKSRLTELVNPSAPTASPRGKPLSDFVGKATKKAAATHSATPESTSGPSVRPAAQTEDARSWSWAWWLAAAGLLAIALVVVRRRWRRHPVP